MADRLRSNEGSLMKRSTAVAEVRTLSETGKTAMGQLPDAALGVHDEPGALFAILLSTAKNNKRRQTVEALRAACEAESGQPRPHFDYAHIARRVKEMRLVGGPTLRTIYNNRELKAFIDAYEARYEPEAPKGEEHVLRGISDLQTRHEVRLLLAEKEKLQRRVQILHEQFQRLSVAAAPTPVHAAPAPAASLSEDEIRERRAVSTFVRLVERHGMYWDNASGALMQSRDDRAREVAGPGFLQALQRLTGDPLSS